MSFPTSATLWFCDSQEYLVNCPRLNTPKIPSQPCLTRMLAAHLQGPAESPSGSPPCRLSWITGVGTMLRQLSTGSGGPQPGWCSADANLVLLQLPEEPPNLSKLLLWLPVWKFPSSSLGVECVIVWYYMSVITTEPTEHFHWDGKLQATASR